MSIGSNPKSVLIRLIDGNQNQVSADFVTQPSTRFKVPFHNGIGDSYTVIASADGFVQTGFAPIPVSSSATQAVDVMLVPRQATFNFAGASWADLEKTNPRVRAILAQGAASNQVARDRYNQLLEDRGPVLACLWNLMTAMEQIHLPAGSPLEYLKELVWNDIPGSHLLAPRQDRFYAWGDAKLVDQVKVAAQHGEFAHEIGASIFHYGATSTFKQIQFGEANIELTFYENDKRVFNGVECVGVEASIDYFKDLQAHALLEVVPNILTGGLNDPKTVYVLRWMAGRQAGVPDFNPPYTVE
jgi:hypothetical protein